MNKEQFLKELEELLKNIPEQEREAALTYYREYFEDAGKENEYTVLGELGTPQQIAEIILSDIEIRKKGAQENEMAVIEPEKAGKTEEIAEEKSEESEQNTANTAGGIPFTAYTAPNQGMQNFQGNPYESGQKKSNKTLWIVLASVFGGILLISGIIIWLIHGFVSRGTMLVKEITEETVQEIEWETSLAECGAFSKISCSVAAGELFIYQSETDELKVTGEYVGKDFEPYVEDGVFYLNEDIPYSAFFDISKITVYIPKQMYQEITIELGAGSGHIEKLTADNIAISVGAGELKASDLKSGQLLTLDIGAGCAEISGMTANNVQLDCGVGEASVSGEILGDGSFDCAAGEVTLDLLGDLKLYNYDVTCDVGEVLIGEEKISMDSQYVDNGASKCVKANCSVGKVNIK